MIIEHNIGSPTSPSFNNSWTHSVDLLNPSKDSNDDHFIPNIPSSMSLPREKVATIQRHATSTAFQSRNRLPSEDLDEVNRLSIDEYNEECRYNIPLHERFHDEKDNQCE